VREGSENKKKKRPTKDVQMTFTRLRTPRGRGLECLSSLGIGRRVGHSERGLEKQGPLQEVTESAGKREGFKGVLGLDRYTSELSTWLKQDGKIVRKCIRIR